MVKSERERERESMGKRLEEEGKKITRRSFNPKECTGCGKLRTKTREK